MIRLFKSKKKKEPKEKPEERKVVPIEVIMDLFYDKKGFFPPVSYLKMIVFDKELFFGLTGGEAIMPDGRKVVWIEKKDRNGWTEPAHMGIERD